MALFLQLLHFLGHLNNTNTALCKTRFLFLKIWADRSIFASFNFASDRKLEGNITKSHSYFVHVLFEAAVDAVALRHRTLELVKLFGVHVKLGRVYENIRKKTI